jgi:hypothetical protein
MGPIFISRQTKVAVEEDKHGPHSAPSKHQNLVTFEFHPAFLMAFANHGKDKDIVCSDSF